MRGAQLLLVLLICALCSVTVKAGYARAFADSSLGTRVFVDQMPNGMSPEQMQFAATHYVGTQKMTSDWATQIRMINPGFIILHYQLAVGAGPVPFLVGNSWVNDFDVVNRTETWFLHTSDNPPPTRIHEGAFDWYVMNLGDLSDSGWPKYWVDTAISRVNTNQDDGVFADSYTQDILFGQVTPGNVQWFYDVPTCKANWIPLLNAFGAYCHNALKDAGIYYIPNMGGLVTSWDTTDYGIGDGAMNEGFCRSSPGNYYDISDWRLEMDRALALTAAEKIFIAQTGTSSDITDRFFVFGSYLLTKGKHSYIHMIESSGGLNADLDWWPEYDIDLGTYNSPPPTQVSSLLDSSGAYVRAYAKGSIYVNPDSSSVTITLSTTMYQVSASELTGGGLIGTDGKANGNFTSVAVSGSIIMPAHSALILLTQPQSGGGGSGGNGGISYPTTGTTASNNPGSTSSGAPLLAPFWKDL